jgi:hypothetical protein
MLDTGCTGLNALNPVCQAGSLGGTLASSGIDAVLSGLSQWVASGAEWLLAQIGDVLTSTTTVDIGASWFRTHYGVMTALAGVVILPLLLISTLQAIYRQNPGQLIRAFFVQLPLALLLGVVAIQIVILCLSATDAMCTAVAGGTGSDVTSLLSTLTTGLVAAVADPGLATFVLLMVGLLVAVAAFVLWLELLIRAAAVYVAVLFLPLALATLVWPSVSHWCRRLVETLAALILSKFVIVATLSLAAGAITSGTAGTGDHGSGFASVLGGGALLVLATFVPFAILKLIPVVEAGAMGHLEGIRQRGTSAMTRPARTAASFALSEGMAAAGNARLLATSDPPGTGGAVGSGGGGGGGGGVSEEELVAQVDNGNGGLLANSEGKMVGNPQSQAVWEAEVASAGASDAPSRGPKPTLGRTVAGGDGGDGGGDGGGGGGGDGGGGGGDARDLAPNGTPYIGHPPPWATRCYVDDDGSGPTIRFMPALEPMPEKYQVPYDGWDSFL